MCFSNNSRTSGRSHSSSVPPAGTGIAPPSFKFRPAIFTPEEVQRVWPTTRPIVPAKRTQSTEDRHETPSKYLPPKKRRHLNDEDTHLASQRQDMETDFVDAFARLKLQWQDSEAECLEAFSRLSLRNTDSAIFKCLKEDRWVHAVTSTSVTCVGCKQVCSLQTEGSQSGRKTVKKQGKNSAKKPATISPKGWLAHREHCRAIFALWLKENSA